jgi:microcompartment protein CcmK/EutM
MARSRDYRSYCRALLGAGGGMAVAVSESSSDRNAQVATQSPSDLRVMASAGQTTQQRRAFAPSALKLLVAERSA